MRTRIIWIAMLVVGLALPGVAIAQDGAGGGIDEIVVTARKREESLQDIPLSVTALTADAIEGLGIDNVDDVGALAPNLYMTQTPGSSANIGVSIRGVGGAEPLLTRDTGVAIYVDDAYVARTAGAAFDLVDLARVEVLRGPQGTRYGRNATGGAIKFISRRPSEEFGLKQSFSLGRWGQFHSRTTIDTGELGSTGLRATGTFLYKERDGYLDNTVADEEDDPGAYETEGVRIAIDWNPSENFNAYYSFDYVDIDGAPPAFQVFGIGPTQQAARANAGIVTPLDLGEEYRDRLTLDRDGASLWEIMGHSLTLSWDIGDFTLKSITTYREWENEELGTELDGTGPITIGETGAFTCPLFAVCAVHSAGAILTPTSGFSLFHATNEREQDQISQEFQFSGAITETVDFQVGLYWFKEEFEENNIQSFLAPIPTSAAMLPPGSSIYFVSDPITGNPTLFAYEGENESIAVFGEVNVALTDALDLSVGGRWTKDEKEYELFTAPSGPNSGDDDWSNVDWAVELLYSLNDDINVYGRIATAFKSGGFNPRSGDLANTPFDQEEVTNYELGTKTTLLDGRLQVNAAIFLTDYDDLQTDQFAAGLGGATSITVNAGKAEIKGFELEAKFVPTERIAMYLNYGYQDMEYDEYEVRHPITNNVLNIADDTFFAYRPENSLSAGIEYRLPVGDGMELSFRLDGRYLDELTWHATPDSITDPTAPPGLETVPLTPFSACGSHLTGVEAACIAEDDYVVLDARITLSEIRVGEFARAKVALWGRNILDEEYIVSGIDFGALGFGGARWGEPASYGVDVTFEF